MKYDPIKRGLGEVFNRTPFLRKLFYHLLDLLLLRAWHIKRELRKARRQTGPLAEVLDAGSGFGQYTWFMSRLSNNWKIKGVDVKEEQVEDCNRFFGKIGRGDQVCFETGDLTKLREKEKYHIVLCVDVMEHILEDTEVFKNFVFSMRKGGILLISTPSDQGGSDVHDDHEDSFIEEHVRDGYNIKKSEKSGITVTQNIKPDEVIRIFRGLSEIFLRLAGKDLMAIVNEVPDCNAYHQQAFLCPDAFLLYSDLSVQSFTELPGCVIEAQNRYRTNR